MAAKAPAPDPAGIAALPSIALSLRQGDASACERAAVQLRDLAATGSGDTQIAACVAIANNSDLVNAAFVEALRRPGLSDNVQHALVVTMMSMLLHDDVKHESTPMMLACPFYMPVLLRIIAQPRSRYIPQTPLSTRHTLCSLFLLFVAASKPFDQLRVSYTESTARPMPNYCRSAFPASLFASSTTTATQRTTECAPCFA